MRTQKEKLLGHLTRQLNMKMKGISTRNVLVALVCVACLYIFITDSFGVTLFMKRYKGSIGSFCKNHTNISLLHTKSTAFAKLLEVDCNPGVPCKYPEVVDFRIIILTFNRAKSLTKLLKSLDKLEGLGKVKVMMDIWVDRDKSQKLNKEVVQVAKAFNWTKGRVRTHVQKRQVGIYGQWIQTWRPPVSGKEIAVILEDDLSVSPHMYRWLKAAHAAYDGRTDIGGYTLHCGNQLRSKGGGYITQLSGAPYLYKLLGTWGYSPHPKAWRNFQDWFGRVRYNLHPYVDGLVLTDWYKGFEQRHFEDSMWEQWFIYFSDKSNLYSLYSNLHEKIKNPQNKGQCLGMHRREPGLHYKAKGDEDISSLLMVWKDDYIKFPTTPVLLEWTGKPK